MVWSDLKQGGPNIIRKATVLQLSLTLHREACLTGPNFGNFFLYSCGKYHKDGINDIIRMNSTNPPECMRERESEEEGFFSTSELNFSDHCSILYLDYTRGRCYRRNQHGEPYLAYSKRTHSQIEPVTFHITQ